jgi:hypothetical protein
MSGQFRESIVKKRVGGSLSRLDPLRRVEMLRANARFLQRQDGWKPPLDDGTFVRKTVGSPR